MFALWKESYGNLDRILRSRDIAFWTKVCIVKAMVFLVAMYGCEDWTIKKDWVLKNWLFQTAVLEKTLENLLDSKEIEPAIPKENQPWIFMGKTDAAAEALALWRPDAKSQVIGKDLDARKVEGKRRRGWQRISWLDVRKLLLAQAFSCVSFQMSFMILHLGMWSTLSYFLYIVQGMNQRFFCFVLHMNIYSF